MRLVLAALVVPLALGSVACRAPSPPAAIASPGAAMAAVSAPQPALGSPVAPATPVASPVPKPAPTAEATPAPTLQATSTPTPAPTPAPMSNFSSAEIGISLHYPAGWFLESTAATQRIRITSFQPASVGTETLPPGAVIFELFPAEPSNIPGSQPYVVGTESYPGSLGTGDPSGAFRIDHVISIDYQAAGRSWHISGYFAEVADQSNPNYEAFMAIIQSIHHQPTALAARTPTPAPSPRPTPRPTPTTLPTPASPPFSAAYLNPQAAIRQALRETGQSDAVNDPWTVYLLERATWFQALYHIATADVGDFNDDTSDFLPWLEDLLAAMNSNSPEATADLQDLTSYTVTQIKIGIRDPSSNLGQRLRRIEAGRDPVFKDPGPGAYWDYLLAGYALRMSPTAQNTYVTRFQSTILDYQTSPTTDFGTYLANSDFFKNWFK